METIVLIGAGNVGHHLALRLFEKGQNILQIFSRSASKTEKLASRVEAETCTKISQIRQDGSLYILAVNDDSIKSLSRELSLHLPSNALVVHTSGATPGSLLGDFFVHYGVFYPLQTFTTDRPVQFDSIPICIDAPIKKDLKRLESLAKTMSTHVQHVGDDQRAILHVAAVFVNNFVNYLYSIGFDILESHQLPFSLLQPLMEETVAKVRDFSPRDMQTGPAIRGDVVTIKRHLELLKDQPNFQNIYDQLSQEIRAGLFSSPTKPQNRKM